MTENHHSTGSGRSLLDVNFVCWLNHPPLQPHLNPTAFEALTISEKKCFHSLMESGRATAVGDIFQKNGHSSSNSVCSISEFSDISDGELQAESLHPRFLMSSPHLRILVTSRRKITDRVLYASAATSSGASVWSWARTNSYFIVPQRIICTLEYLNVLSFRMYRLSSEVL